MRHPEVGRLLARHDLPPRLLVGDLGPTFFYGKKKVDRHAGKDKDGRDVMTPILDPFTPDELESLAAVVAEEMKATHFSTTRGVFGMKSRHCTTYVIQHGKVIARLK